MYNNDDENFIRMEKRATNKVGLTILAIVIIIAIIGGGYYLIKNKNNLSFDLNLPWQKDTENKKKKTKTEKEIAIKRQKVDISDKVIFKNNNFIINPDNIKYDDDSGYSVNIIAEIPNNKSAISLNITNITVDGYQLDNTISANILPYKKTDLSIKIPISFLDTYNLEQITEVHLYGTISSGNKSLKINPVINTNTDTLNTTSLNDLEPLTSTKDVKISYYRVTKEKNNNKIELLIDNQSETNNYTFKINQMKINDKIIEDTSFNSTVNYKSKKIVKISVPTKTVKNIEDIELSFFVIKDDNIYITKSSKIKTN